jgi:hypothetical protein
LQSAGKFSRRGIQMSIHDMAFTSVAAKSSHLPG